MVKKKWVRTHITQRSKVKKRREPKRGCKARQGNRKNRGGKEREWKLEEGGEN